MHQYLLPHAGGDSECASALVHLLRGRRQYRNKPSLLEFNDLMFAWRKKRWKVKGRSRHRELPEAGRGEIRGGAVRDAPMNRIPCTSLYIPFRRVHRKTPLGLGISSVHTKEVMSHPEPRIKRDG